MLSHAARSMTKAVGNAGTYLQQKEKKRREIVCTITSGGRSAPLGTYADRYLVTERLVCEKSIIAGPAAHKVLQFYKYRS
jgi:hypothetical protein